MLESISVVTTWSGNITPQETVTLDYEGRSKRRCLMQTDKGRELLLNLPNATILKHGNVLEINDGSFVLYS